MNRRDLLKGLLALPAVAAGAKLLDREEDQPTIVANRAALAEINRGAQLAPSSVPVALPEEAVAAVEDAVDRLGGRLVSLRRRADGQFEAGWLYPRPEPVGLLATHGGLAT